MYAQRNRGDPRGVPRKVGAVFVAVGLTIATGAVVAEATKDEPAGAHHAQQPQPQPQHNEVPRPKRPPYGGCKEAAQPGLRPVPECGLPVTSGLADALAEGSAPWATSRDWEACIVHERGVRVTVTCPDGYQTSWVSYEG